MKPGRFPSPSRLNCRSSDPHPHIPVQGPVPCNLWWLDGLLHPKPQPFRPKFDPAACALSPQCLPLLGWFAVRPVGPFFVDGLRRHRPQSEPHLECQPSCIRPLIIYTLPQESLGLKRRPLPSHPPFWFSYAKPFGAQSSPPYLAGDRARR